MPFIEVITPIDAPIQRCFDIARSIDFHVESTAHTGEKAVAGRTTGLIEYGDKVTFSARHMGARWKLSSEIIKFDPPNKFTDRMLKGPFKKLLHEHIFDERDGITTMTDRMQVHSPFGIVGRLFDSMVLEGYMRKFLEKRCNSIKECAESDEWKKYIPET